MNRSRDKRFLRSATMSVITAVLACSLLPGPRAIGPTTTARPGALISLWVGRHLRFAQSNPTPPTDALCRAQFNAPCYSPREMRSAYGLSSVLDAGYTGKGQTIVIIDSFGSPTIMHDLKTFDAGYSLPDPPSFKVLAPLGTVPFNPSNGTEVGWAAEATLDVEWSHAMAPDASIVLLTSPVPETEGVQGMPEFRRLEQYALDNHLGQIISQSWGATENTLFTRAGLDVFSTFESLYKQAASQHVTVFASTGDSGSSNVDVNGLTYPFPTVGFPASSPWVTAVGGTSLFASTTGRYQFEFVWNDGPGFGSGGGGISQVFAEPDYQQHNLPQSIQTKLDGHRGIPDISYNADPNTAILIYLSFLGASQAGYYIIGGTSEGSPQWAGIIADGNQWAGHPLGFLNPALYAIGNSPDAAMSYHDITIGTNSYNNVPGYYARPGWDLASGWGTPQAQNLLARLIAYAPAHP